MALTLHKQERLSGKTQIAQLFEKGNPKVNGFPFRFSWVYQSSESTFPAQALFLVSKKKVGRANQRNRIKRQMREAYRLLKPDLYAVLEKRNLRILLSIAYLADKPMPSSEVSLLFQSTFKKLLHELEKHH